MSGELATLAECLARCNVDISEAASADVLGLLRLVSDEVRAITRRPLEGVATVYTQTVEAGTSSRVRLPKVPVTDLLSVRRAVLIGDRHEFEVYAPELVEGGASTTLAASAAVGATNLKVTSVTGMTAGDHLAVGSGLTKEVVRASAVGTAGAGGTGVTTEPALAFAQSSGGAVQECFGSLYWELVEADRGIFERTGTARWLQVVWRTSGVVDRAIEESVVEWVSSLWSSRDFAPGQTSYSTGRDSESRSAPDKIGEPPTHVGRILGRYMVMSPYGGPV